MHVGILEPQRNNILMIKVLDVIAKYLTKMSLMRMLYWSILIFHIHFNLYVLVNMEQKIPYTWLHL